MLAYIKYLLTGIEIVEPTTALYYDIVENMQEVWDYKVLTGCLEPMYKEDVETQIP